MKYDVVIIGGGPAGLSAGIFASRAGLKTLCVEQICFGGQTCIIPEIANYPGLGTISGFELAQKLAQDAKNSDVEFEFATVKAIKKTKTGFSVETKLKNYFAKQVVLACGSKPKRLGLPNEKYLIGKGVSYCASCDGAFFKGKTVMVVGGGNSAIIDVIYLSHLAKKVYLIHRRNEFGANKIDVEKIKTLKNVEIITPAIIEQLIGEEMLESVIIKHKEAKEQIKVDGLFVAIGAEPDLDFVKIDIKKDKNGYILVDESMQTSVKYLYACGDIISKKFKQIVSAVADGAIAGNSCIGGK